MKKLGAFLIMLSLLGLVPAAFAADGDLPVRQPADSNLTRSEASDVPRHEDSTIPSRETRSIQPSADQDWTASSLREPGLYRGQDGALHNVPGLQDPRIKIR